MESWKGVATHQYGLIARTQLRCSGLTGEAIRWQVRVGALEEELPGVFRLSRTPQAWEQRMMAAWRADLLQQTRTMVFALATAVISVGGLAFAAARLG